MDFSPVQSLSHVWLFATPWTAACQASISITNCRSLPKPMSIELVMPSNHLILCRPLLLLPSIFPSIKWTVIGEFNSDDHYVNYCGQKSLRRNGVAIIVNKRVQNVVLGCNLKNYRMISNHFQDKPFNITVIQFYAPTSNAEEAKVEQFYEDLQDLLELTPKKDVLFIIGDWDAKVASQETPGVTGIFGLGV